MGVKGFIQATLLALSHDPAFSSRSRIYNLARDFSAGYLGLFDDHSAYGCGSPDLEGVRSNTCRGATRGLPRGAKPHEALPAAYC